MTMQVRATGIAWFRKEDYDRLRNEVFEDGHVLSPTWHEWNTQAQQLVKQLEAQGHVVVKAHIDPDTFADWCAANGLNVDANGRKRFASLVAAEKHGSTH